MVKKLIYTYRYGVFTCYWSFFLIVNLRILCLNQHIIGRTKKNSRKNDESEGKEEEMELPLFDMNTIVDATNNFSSSNKLGEGGFGSVYKVICICNVCMFKYELLKLYDDLGYIKRGARNSSKEAFKKFWPRTEGVQK